MSKILVTGGAGYIGSLLTESLLKKNHKVTVIDNLMYNQNSLYNACHYGDYFDFIKGDVCDINLITDFVKKNDIIIPLAAIVGAPACNLFPQRSKEINLHSYLSLLKILSKNQIVIFPTTNSGYGIGKSNKFCDENSPLNPITTYGKYKVEIEKIILEKENSISLRLATVFGASPRMRTDLLVNDFVYKAVKDKYIILFEEHFKRNYIHIKDVVKTFLFAIDNFEKMKNNSYNVGLEEANLSKKELALKIKDYVRDFYIHSASIGTDPDKRDYIVTNKKLMSLSWKPIYDLDYGIKELISYYKFLNSSNHKNI